jgi:hypothetical protein
LITSPERTLRDGVRDIRGPEPFGKLERGEQLNHGVEHFRNMKDPGADSSAQTEEVNRKENLAHAPPPLESECHFGSGTLFKGSSGRRRNPGEGAEVKEATGALGAKVCFSVKNYR